MVMIIRHHRWVMKSDQVILGENEEERNYCVMRDATRDRFGGNFTRETRVPVGRYPTSLMADNFFFLSTFLFLPSSLLLCLRSRRS